jgi:CBS domain-containing protein
MPKLVRDCMTKSPITIGLQETLRSAQELMGLRRIRHLPVIEHGKLVGLLTESDLRRVMPSPISPHGATDVDGVLDGTPVGRVMVKTPTTVGPGQPLRDAVKILVDKKYGALPVVEDGKLVGILSVIDALRASLDLLT